MLQELKFALYAIKKNIQSSAELRTSFLVSVLGMMINNVAFIILWVFFVKSVGVIGGWTAADVVGLQGFTAFAYGASFSLSAGVQKLPQYVSTGAFDRFMLSPKNILVRVATSSFSPSAVGDATFGVICLITYGFLIHATLLQAFMIIVLSIVSTFTFFSTVVAIYSVSFLFADADSAVRSLFEFFLTPSLFHGGAIQGAMRAFFVFAVPALLIGTIPVEAVRHVVLSKFGLLLLLALVWMFLGVYLFNRAVRKYESSNLMTFGG